MLTYSLLSVYTHRQELRITLNHTNIMSSENTNLSEGLSGFSLDPDLMDCHISRQSNPTSLKELIENELVGVPLSAQKAALSHLLHLLGTKNASHLNKL